MNGIYSDSVPQELVDSTIKRAARRWAIKRALIGLGALGAGRWWWTAS